MAIDCHGSGNMMLNSDENEYFLIISNFGEAITNRLFLSYLISRDSKVN